MEAINPNAQLVSIFGPPEYNNFNEPVPFSNQPRCLIGFTTAFLVSFLLVPSCHRYEGVAAQVPIYITTTSFADMSPGSVLGICVFSTLCSPQSRTSARSR